MFMYLATSPVDQFIARDVPVKLSRVTSVDSIISELSS